MKIPAKEKVWNVPRPTATYASRARYVLGCERCRSTCVTEDPCPCCRAYAARGHFPEDKKGHGQIMSITHFRTLYESEPTHFRTLYESEPTQVTHG